MYISPLTVLALLPAGVAPGDADLAAGLADDMIGGTSTCWIPFLAWIWALIFAAAAATGLSVSQWHRKAVFDSPTAAAGSTPPDFGGSALALSESFSSGLLLRRGSDLLAGGERDRRSNLEALLGSGSV